MIRQLLFTLFLLVACGYAFWRGGRPERWTALIFIAGYVLSVLALSFSETPYARFSFAPVLIDLAMLIAIGWIAFTSGRYWPLWMTAMQIIQLASNFTILLPHVMSLVYAIATSTICYPMIILLIIATYRHRLQFHTGDVRRYSKTYLHLVARMRRA